MSENEKAVSPNCISCALHFFFLFSCPMGLPCYNVTCYKQENGNHKTELKFSKLYLTTSSIFIILLISASMWYGNLIETSILSSTGHIIIITQIISLLRSLRSIISIVNFLLLSKIIKRTILVLEGSLRFWELKNCEILLTQETMYDMRTRAVIILAFIFIFIFGYIFHLFLQEFGLGINFILKFFNCICIYVDLTILFSLQLVSQLWRYILNEFQKNIKTRLKNYEKQFLVNFIMTALQNYRIILTCFKEFNKYTNPVVLIWLILTVSMLVANSYITVRIRFGSNSENVDGLIVLELEIYLLMVVIAYALDHVQDLQSWVSFSIKYLNCV